MPNFSAKISISRVGFSDNLDLAIIYMGVRKGPMSGFGDYIVLEKNNGNWTVKKVINGWIS